MTRKRDFKLGTFLTIILISSNVIKRLDMKYFISGITKRGMSYPTEEFLNLVKLWDSLFEDFHRHASDGLSREFNVVKKFAKLIEDTFPEFDNKKVIKKFALSRTCFRMRAIARKLAAEKADTYRAECKKKQYAHAYQGKKKEKKPVQYFTNLPL